MRALTTKDIKNNILSIYEIGDTIYLINQNNDGGYVHTKYEILDFYDDYVLCQSNGFKECFLYWDLLTKSIKDYALDDKKENDITYSDVYEQFIKYNGIDRNLVSDYRPCTDIPNTIVVWFKNGGMNIYTYQ